MSDDKAVANNVVLFPGIKNHTETPYESVNALRQKHVELIAAQVTDLFKSLLQKYNIKLQNDHEMIRDMAMIKGAVTAGAARACGLPHSMQDLADLMFQINEDGDEISIIPKNLKIYRVEDEETP
jgi:hypothetical protein